MGKVKQEFIIDKGVEVPEAPYWVEEYICTQQEQAEYEQWLDEVNNELERAYKTTDDEGYPMESGSDEHG